MEQPGNSDITKRIERLEQLVENLTEKVNRLLPTEKTQPQTSTPPPPPVQSQQPPLPPPPQKVEGPRESVQPVPLAVPTSSDVSFKFPDYMRKSEYWLNKIGIALLLFGAVFLFKYSVEQGWLTPVIRIFIGLAIGIILCFFGLRLYHKRRPFSQVLLGGAIGTFYITGYAAFQIFQLVSYPAAFSFFITINVLSFFLSLKENDFIFSLIALLGGLGTPFLLYTGESSIPGLMFYLCVLLAAASAIYFFKGWWSLFWTYCIGGWTIIMIALFSNDVPTSLELIEKISIQSSLILALPFFWLMPIARKLALLKEPMLSGLLIPKPGEQKSPAQVINHIPVNLNLLTIIIPFIAFGLTTMLWRWHDNVWGIISLLLGLVVALVGMMLDKKTDLKVLTYTHFNIGLIFATIAVYYFLDGNVLLVALTLEAVALHLAKIKVGDKTLTPIAHTLFAIVTLWIVERIFESQSGMAVVNMKTISDFVVPAGAITLSFLFKEPVEKRIYSLVGFALLAGIFSRELSGNDYFLTLTILSAAKATLSLKMNDREGLIAVHVFNAIVGCWLIYRLIGPPEGTAIFNYMSAVDLLFVIFTASTARFLLTREEKVTYYIAAHIGLLMWFLRELAPLENGQGLVSAAWGIYIVALFVIGLRRNVTTLTKVAMATLFVLIGKLFLIDLANIETIWRVLLFLGFGAVLLFLSYYFKSLWKLKSD